jgi:glycosyltransferase involved in cell wall biosynthesis
MKILIIGSIPQKLVSIKGGVESATVNLLQGLSAFDVEVRVLSFRKDLHEKTVLQFSENINIHFFPYKLIRSTKLFLLLVGNFIVYKFVKSYKPDIIHLQGAATSLLLTLFLNKDKLIVTPHGILSEELKYKKSFRQRVNVKFMLTIEKALIHKIRNFIFISQYSQNAIYENHNLKVDHLKTCIVNNPANNNFLKNITRERDTHRILYIGTIRRLKGLLFLIQVIASINLKGIKLRLDIVGDFEEEDYKTEILNFLEKAGISDQLNFHGWVDQNKVKELMTHDFLFVLSSMQENYPLSVIEAMASGMVVIASNVGALHEIIEDRVSGFLFEPANKDQLENIILETIKNKTEAARIGQTAHQLIHDNHRPEIIAESTLCFYKKVADYKNNF